MEPITAKNIEILLLKLNLNNSKYPIMIYYGKEESCAKKEESFPKIKTILKMIDRGFLC